MKSLYMMIGLLAVLGLTACDSGEEPRSYSGPELQGFHMIDSYDVDTERDFTTPLELSPYQYDGLFDVYWYVDSRRDYTLLIGVNDRPSMNGATIVGSDLCGVGLSCGSLGTYICRYTSDFYMGCGQVEGEADINLADVAPFIDSREPLPQRVYLNMEVCDTGDGGCELSSLPVWLH